MSGTPGGSRMRVLFACLLVPALAAPAFAQKPSPFTGDARLEKPVTVRWKKTTVYNALREISGRTGAHLTPDRAIVDEPVMAAATGVPAREVLEQMGTLLHYTWVRTGGT